MKKLSVFFPGIGYTVDKPLLYYSRKIASKYDYEIKLLPYGGFPEKVKGDRGRMVKSFEIALEQAREMLRETDLAAYDEILFVGKSIGTIVAAKLAAESRVPERIRMVLYTPLPDTFSFPVKEAIVFTGDADPWVGEKENRIPEMCEGLQIPCELIPKANHSLETEDPLEDIRNLKKIMKATERFIAGEA